MWWYSCSDAKHWHRASALISEDLPQRPQTPTSTLDKVCRWLPQPIAMFMLRIRRLMLYGLVVLRP